MGIPLLAPEATDRIIEMAWEDRTPFEAIKFQFGLSEAQVIALMRTELKPGSFRRWRRRVQGRMTKHRQLRIRQVNRFKCSRQRQISRNVISKRI
ncbi:MAG: TIGR03643 family protein [Bacteroidetes bacterium]|nr:MAG: TIGR03643 family protein [Bacteroidota bacterium]